ncbi:hypothetical protein CHCC20490_2305 [Bacillus paralicheniformis]|nr:hypothetical protein CHCC20490_2305 [Bacillus paralicheniformis]
MSPFVSQKAADVGSAAEKISRKNKIKPEIIVLATVVLLSNLDVL